MKHSVAPDVRCSRCGKPFRNEAALPVLGGLAHWECLTVQECRQKGLSVNDAASRDLTLDIVDQETEF